MPSFFYACTICDAVEFCIFASLSHTCKLSLFYQAPFWCIQTQGTFYEKHSITFSFFISAFGRRLYGLGATGFPLRQPHRRRA